MSKDGEAWERLQNTARDPARSPAFLVCSSLPCSSPISQLEPIQQNSVCNPVPPAGTWPCSCSRLTLSPSSGSSWRMSGATRTSCWDDTWGPTLPVIWGRAEKAFVIRKLDNKLTYYWQQATHDKVANYVSIRQSLQSTLLFNCLPSSYHTWLPILPKPNLTQSHSWYNNPNRSNSAANIVTSSAHNICFYTITLGTTTCFKGKPCPRWPQISRGRRYQS